MTKNSKISRELIIINIKIGLSITDSPIKYRIFSGASGLLTYIFDNSCTYRHINYNILFIPCL
jgi:hypothetical protein